MTKLNDALQQQVYVKKKEIKKKIDPRNIVHKHQ